MKDLNKASEILSDLFAEQPKEQPKTIHTSALKPISELNDKNFIKIAENLFAQADDFQKVWEVTTINGTPYIVSKESSMLYRSDDYTVKESNTGIEIRKADQFVDDIAIPEHADKAAVIADLNEKINCVSFLPTSLVVESMRKEAGIASRRFIDTNKLKLIAEKKTKKLGL